MTSGLPASSDVFAEDAALTATPGRATPSVLRELPTSPAALLALLGLRARKRYSQSFLADVGLTEQIARIAEVDREDRVLEIGPGLGILTRTLARHAGQVVAVELDPGLAAALPALVPPTVEIVHADALTFEPASALRGPYKLVANLPYQITSPFLFRYLALRPLPLLFVLMVQKEVAQRIAAGPGGYSYLAVAVQSVAHVKIVRFVPRGAFHPRPKVDSAIVRLDPLPEPLVPPERRVPFLDVVRAGFAQPRKQLVNSLGQGLGVTRDEALAVLARASIQPDRRPQALSLADWRALADAVTLEPAASEPAVPEPRAP
ncbi:MAG: ribosomal RNA small subunit methyltransferase A [Chloroflexi bacterium]|nr:ribosomal RNA small subunit methyltransferase A [Chloroflexota bacterium]